MNAPVKLAEKCLANAIEIPSAPIWHLSKARIFNSNDSFELLQNTVDYLTCKAKAGLAFSEDEKEFLKELYEAFWWGGTFTGMGSAAELANHYIHGNGKPMAVASLTYTRSVVVKDTMKAMQDYIREQIRNGGQVADISTRTIGFRQSKYFKPLMLINGSRSPEIQGYVLSDGTVFAEELNQALKKADNRFILRSQTHAYPKYNMTQYKVENIYDFEPFALKKEDKYTDLSLGNKTLLLPDGLSEYMASTLKIAVEFKYYASWCTKWS